VSATMGAASATETASAMEAASTIEAASAMGATGIASTCVTAAATIEPATAIVPTTAREPAATIVPATAIVPVEPRAGADKDAAGKPAGTVVAVRSARVWVVSIVAIGAHWGRANVTRADSNADRNPLCLCERYRHQASAKQGQES
jgi:hypothetical protein